MKNGMQKNSTIIMTYLMVVVLLILSVIVRPGYLNFNNIQILSSQVAVLGFVTIGQSLVILTGGMDLSVPWMFTIAGFLAANLSNGDNSKVVYVIPIVLVVGVVMGLFNGVGVAYMGIAPVVMTMASNIIFQGLLVGSFNGMPGGTAPSFIKSLSTGSVGPLNYLFLIWLVVSAIALVALYKMPFGRKLYSVGSNEKVAQFSGINVKLIKTSAYALSGLMAALAGILYSGRLGQLYLGMGDEYQMQSIAAVAIGGISLIGGSGSYVGAMAGTLIIIVLNGVLAAINISEGAQRIVYGIVLFIAVLISTRRKNVKLVPVKKTEDG